MSLPADFFLYAGTGAFLLGLHALATAPRPLAAVGLLVLGALWVGWAFVRQYVV